MACKNGDCPNAQEHIAAGANVNYCNIEYVSCLSYCVNIHEGFNNVYTRIVLIHTHYPVYTHITLCVYMYVQQGYVFGHVSLCTYVRICLYIIMSTKKLFGTLPLKNFPLSLICCLLFEFKCLQRGLLHPASYADAFPNKMWRPLAPKSFLLSFNGTMIATSLGTRLHMQHSELTCMLSAHRVCFLWNSSCVVLPIC